jgi:tetratricopeptide (TPR) repeat protein
MLARAPIASKFAVAGASRVDLRARARAPAFVPRASTPVSAGSNDARLTSSSVVGSDEISPARDASALMPRTLDRAQLVAQVSAKAPPAPPADQPSPFVLWCRGNWGYFAALQTVALIGASYNGRLARKRRLEIADINDKLRAMMAKYEGKLGSMDMDDDSGPASEALAAGKAALVAEDFDAAAGKFAEAKKIAEDHGDAQGVLSGAKGTATALMRAGQLRAAVAELESVVQLAVSEGDSSVYGMLGDAHTDLAELGKAGEYYDRCLEMD